MERENGDWMMEDEEQSRKGRKMEDGIEGYGMGNEEWRMIESRMKNGAENRESRMENTIEYEE